MTRSQRINEEEKRALSSVLKHSRAAYNLTGLDCRVAAKIIGYLKVSGCDGPEDIILAFDYIACDEWEADDPQSVVCSAADFFGIDHDEVCR